MESSQMAFLTILRIGPAMLLIIKDDFYEGQDVIEKPRANLWKPRCH
jgi:hypothetical protein